MSNETPKKSNLETNMAIESIQAQQVSIAKEAMPIGLFTQLQSVSEALGIVSVNQLEIAKLKALSKGSLVDPSAFIKINKALESMRVQQSEIEKIRSLGTVAKFPFFSDVLKTLSTHQLEKEKIKALGLASIIRPSALDAFRNQQLSMAREAMSVSSYIQSQGVAEPLKAISSQQQSLAKLTELRLGSILYSSKSQGAFDSLLATNNSLLVGSDYISEMVDIVSDIDFNALCDEIISEEEMDEAVIHFTEINNSQKFIDVFSNIKPWLQVLFLHFVLQLYQLGVDVFSNVTANLLTPYVEEYLQENFRKDNRQKVNDIKTISRPFENIDTSGLRFITSDIVMLRIEPSTKSEIKDELILGQIVTVLEKKKNWIKVMYQYEDGELIDGWVFTRYTHKFVK